MVTKGKGERARREEDKLARREALLDSALRLWDEQSYTDLTMADIARGAGLAKSSVYLYFQTKEEVFLAALERLLGGWFGDVNTALDEARTTGPAEVAALLVQSLDSREHMIRLLAILNGVLEQNIPAEVGVGFKARLMDHLIRTGARLERCLPGLPPGHGTRVLLHLNALVVGLQQVTAETPALRAAAGDPALAGLVLDFRAELEAALTALLHGSLREE
ncbi:TetR family transcriptional regulator (plasmid) [Deinococcus aetherius]|uniref:TetR family transcriptional regulator n=1 Tax=Deinococcus aetherius TaxID=200252 RepID=A0ABN6RNB3_9DEIO|nr:TetR family transcriptional regulator [Deinococcus aetherius]BDP43821.1 TetR family transcriptional regulator [Deinococcus aetherius]